MVGVVSVCVWVISYRSQRKVEDLVVVSDSPASGKGGGKKGILG